MASLRAIRSRIKSVKGTQKITKAMKMVAAAKLRRAQDAATRARPYVHSIEAMLSRMVHGAEDKDGHPLLLVREGARKAEVLVLTSDRGLCGGFNSNIIRRLQRFLIDNEESYDSIHVSTIGRRGRDFAKKRGITVRAEFGGRASYENATDIAEDLAEQFLAGECDVVYLVYNHFHSPLVQEVTMAQLLPIEPDPNEPDEDAAVDFNYEPDRDTVLEQLLPKHLAMQIWRAMLESEASEHGARMTAMDSATKNAKEMVSALTLVYNRARQAAITKELMEIVSGAESLK